MVRDRIVIIHPNRKIELIGEITGTFQNNITFLSNDVTTFQEIKQLFEEQIDIIKFKKFDIKHNYGNFRGCFINEFSTHNLFTEVTFTYDTFYEVDMNTQIMMKIEEYYRFKKHNTSTIV